MIKVGIIIPAYNESLRIENTLKLYGEYFTEEMKKDSNMLYEILISINGTTDNTKELVEEAMEKYSLISFIENKDPGKGLAIKRGMDYFLNQKDVKYIGYVDADSSTPAKEYHNIIKQCILLNKNVSANRYDAKSKLVPSPGFKRTIASRTFNFIVRSLFPSIKMRDTQCGCKMFLVNDVRIVSPLLEITQWACDVEIVYILMKNKLSMVEIPTFWENKDYSHIKLGGSSLKMLFSLFRLRLVNSPFKSLIKLYNKIPERYKFHHQV
jgi:dolichyl-phosphate beta-glucosyltransferase